MARGLLVVAVLLAYANSLHGPLILDDAQTIGENPSIRQLWPIGPVLMPPEHVFSAGRPILNLTFALNYAFGGTAVFGYHCVNVLLHAACALMLLAVVSQILARAKLRSSAGTDAHWMAFVIALSWAIHPIQTVAVTYISQRAELLMAFWTLACLYSFARAAETESRGWTTMAIVSCAAGMASKETMVVVPVLILLVDRFFFAPTLAEIFARRWRLHAGLASTWLLLAYLMISSHIAARDVGFTGSYTSWSYAMAEAPILIRYLSLCFWPYPLVFDYGIQPPFTGGDQIAGMVIGLILAALLAWCWLRHRWQITFLGCWFLLLLSPTSSIIPIQAQPMAESRLYLALVAPLCLLVVAARRWCGKQGWLVCALLCASLLVATPTRNRDYQSEFGLWRDVVVKRPDNARGHNILGVLFADRGEVAAAIREHERALALMPNLATAHYNLANALSSNPDQQSLAIEHYTKALELDPGSAQAHNNFANLLAKSPETREAAISHYRTALKLNPNFPEAHHNFASLLAQSADGRAEAAAHYLTAIQQAPRFVEALYGYANLLLSTPDTAAEALKYYRRALVVRPDFAPAYSNIGTVLAGTPGHEQEAIEAFEHAVAIDPELVEAHFNAAVLLERVPGKEAEALKHYEAVIRLRPDVEIARQRVLALKLRL